jgi:hypothetical protein
LLKTKGKRVTKRFAKCLKIKKTSTKSRFRFSWSGWRVMGTDPVTLFFILVSNIRSASFGNHGKARNHRPPLRTTPQIAPQKKEKGREELPPSCRRRKITPKGPLEFLHVLLRPVDDGEAPVVDGLQPLQEFRHKERASL